jgi:hypothetical protein
MSNNKLVLASFVALAMLAMAASTILTQETYAAHKHGRILVGTQDLATATVVRIGKAPFI